MSFNESSVTTHYNLALWPKPNRVPEKDSLIEGKVDSLLSRMSLAEKIGQMTQVEIHQVTPEEIRQYHIGSVLNAGGSTPKKKLDATVDEWLELADMFWSASCDETDGFVGVPILWGTDAVHGHNNVSGATIFPHNIGLGGIQDQQLIHDIYEATAKEVAATGIDWVFAPTLTVVRDCRWGRTYEGYADDFPIVVEHGKTAIKALQGDFSEHHVIATAKHFIGDGDTDQGVDQGDSLSTEEELARIHAPAYVAAIEADVQTVMASFNSWQGHKLHGHQYLLTTVLKEHMGFDGFVISDWNGVGQVSGCTNQSCAKAINAGVDMIMVPYREDWIPFIENTYQQVKNGEIAESRIDDAVRRILRVKVKAGMFEKPKPSQRQASLNQHWVGCKEHRGIAKEAVKESLMLLKNQKQTLPLERSTRIAVVGNAADNLSRQCGGWSLSWQGCGIPNAFFGEAQSVSNAINDYFPLATYFEDIEEINQKEFDVILVVLGEEPYAEGLGDIGPQQKLEYACLYPDGVELLDRVKSFGLPIVTVLFSGRPIVVNQELNRSDAFIAAYLPGSEGAGVVEALTSDLPPSQRVQSAFSWPMSQEQTGSRFFHQEQEEPLFSIHDKSLFQYDHAPVQQQLNEASNLQEGSGAFLTNHPLKLFFANHVAPWKFMYQIDQESENEINFEEISTAGFQMESVDDGFGIQWGGRKIQFQGSLHLSVKSNENALSKCKHYLLSSHPVLCFDLKLEDGNIDECWIGLGGEQYVTLLDDLMQWKGKGWNTYRITSEQLMIDSKIMEAELNQAFSLVMQGEATFTIANIRWEVNKS